MSFHIPDFNRIIFWRWNNKFFIWSNSHTRYWIGMCIFQLHDGIFCLCVPESDAAIVVARYDVCFGSRDVHVVAFWIGIDCSINMSCIHVPQFDSRIKWGCQYSLLRKTKFSWCDLILMCNIWMFWPNISTQRVQSCPVISWTRHQKFVVERKCYSTYRMCFAFETCYFLHFLYVPQSYIFISASCC